MLLWSCCVSLGRSRRPQPSSA